MYKVMALDVGTKRIGVALSDFLLMIANEQDPRLLSHNIVLVYHVLSLMVMDQVIHGLIVSDVNFHL